MKFKNKILSVLLVIAMVLSMLISLSACLPLHLGNGGKDDSGKDDGSADDGGTDGDDDGTDDDGGDGGDGSGNANEDDEQLKNVIRPDYKDYHRDTINFEDIEYSRPDVGSLIEDFKALTDEVTSGSTSFESQLSTLISLGAPYVDANTMYSFINIQYSKNVNDEFWSGEYEYITRAMPEFSTVLKDFFVAVANSESADLYEQYYFGEGFTDKYKTKNETSAELVELLAEETALENEYNAISTASIEITYRGTTDTVDKILEFYKSHYGESSYEYLSAYPLCMSLYQQKVQELSTEIFIELIKTRSLIADELGYDSYMDYAYESMGHSYSRRDFANFLEEIPEYVVPVYSKLYSYVFKNAVDNQTKFALRLDDLINKSYAALLGANDELADIFAYMLQHNLYDIRSFSEGRRQVTYETYLQGYNAPFIFINTDGNVTDYQQLFHEFGHFSRDFLAYNGDASVDLEEIYSQGLEILMPRIIESEISSSEAQYLKLSMFQTVLTTLIFQSFYANFEELAYDLDYADITEKRLDEIVVSLAMKYHFNLDAINDLSSVFIPHLFLYPSYVHSYAVSVVPSIELYFMECEDKSGLETYMTLLKIGRGLSLEEHITAVGLTSPFADGAVKRLANLIHFYTLGSYYYPVSDDAA